jgi:hypothetical protein
MPRTGEIENPSTEGKRCVDLSQLRKLTREISGEEEISRLKILRETQLLDTDTCEELFDRYSHFAKRLFNVPLCVISLVDKNRVWFKSVAGKLSAAEVPREVSFASCAIATCADVFLLNDTLENEEYKNSPLVVGPPHIRFYVGAPIIVENARIGSLCLIDYAPRNLSEDDIKTVLDVGEIVADVIRERRNAAISRYVTRSQMIQQLMHNLRTPLQAIEMSTTILDNIETNDTSADCGQSTTKTSEGHGKEEPVDDLEAAAAMISTVDVAEEELYAATSHLVLLVESSLNLSEIIVESSMKRARLSEPAPSYAIRSSIDYTKLPGVGPHIGKLLASSFAASNNDISPPSSESTPRSTGGKSSAKKCKVLSKVYDARRKLDSIFSGKVLDIDWDVDLEGHLTSGKYYPSSQRNAKVVYFVLLRSVEMFASRWHNMKIFVRFVPSETHKNDEEGEGGKIAAIPEKPVDESSTGNKSEDKEAADVEAEEEAQEESPTTSSNEDTKRGVEDIATVMTSSPAKKSGSTPQEPRSGSDTPSSTAAATTTAKKQWQEGHIHFTFVGSKQRKEKSFAEEAHLDFYTLEEVLLDVEGWSTRRVDEASGGEVIDCWIPHTVYVGDSSNSGSRSESVSEINVNRISRMSSTVSSITGTEEMAAVKRKPGGNSRLSSRQASGIWVASKSSTPTVSPKPGFKSAASEDGYYELSTGAALFAAASSSSSSAGVKNPNNRGSRNTLAARIISMEAATGGAGEGHGHQHENDPMTPRTVLNMKSADNSGTPTPRGEISASRKGPSMSVIAELTAEGSSATAVASSPVVRPSDPKPSSAISPRARLSHGAAVQDTSKGEE